MNNVEKTLILSALDNGLDAAQEEADEYHRTMAGYRQYRHDYLDAAVVDIKAAIEILKKEEATDGLMDKAADEIDRLNAKIAGGIRVNVKLNDKRQISYISNYEANATVVMDE